MAMSPERLEALQAYVANMSHEEFRAMVREADDLVLEDAERRLVGKTQRVLACSAAEAAPIVDRILTDAQTSDGLQPPPTKRDAN
jgi:hypothetical protein